MKRVVKITQTKLAELLMREAGNGFLEDDPNYKDASYRMEQPNQSVQPEIKKYTVEFSEEEINLIEDILEGVHPENKNEEDLLFKIKHNLRDSLLKK